MGKRDDDFEDLSMDLDNGSIGDELEDAEGGATPERQRPRKQASPNVDDLDDEGFDETEQVPAPRAGKKKKSVAAPASPASRRKNLIAGTLIGIMVVVGSAGFVYMTMKPAAPRSGMSPFDAAPAPQTALTQAAQPEQLPQESASAPAPAPLEQSNAQVMAETPSAAIAGGEVSLEHERLQQATQQAVSAATQDLSNQVLAMGVQIADLQARLAESSNRSVCDTDAIVAELRRKMKEDESSPKSVAKATPKQDPPKEAAKPAPVVKAPKKKAIDEWKVLGLSADRAVVVTAKGDQVVVTAGDVIEGVTIKKIDPVQGAVVTNEGTVK